MGGCGQGLCRALLFIFNFLFWLTGILIAGLAVWIKVDKSVLHYINLANEILDNKFVDIALWVMIGVGAFIMIVGFFGCCGAITKSAWMLGIFMAFLVLIFIAEIGFGVLALIFRDKIEDKVSNEGYKIVSNKTGSDAEFTSIVHFMQVELECCGIFNKTDYKNNHNYQTPNNYYPWSCCTLKDRKSFRNKEGYETILTGRDVGKDNFNNYDECQDKSKDTNSIYANGCKENLIKKVKDNAILLGGIGIGIAAVQIIGFILACCLCVSFRKEGKGA